MTEEYSRKELKKIVNKCISYREVMKYTGYNYVKVKKLIEQDEIDISHFTHSCIRKTNKLSIIYKISDKKFAKIVEDSISWSDVVEKCGLPRHAPGNIKTVRKRVIDDGLDYSHFTHKSKNGSKSKISSNELFVYGPHRSAKTLRDRILKEKLIKYKCKICKCKPEWMGKELTLELDHINGDRNDNRLCNLRFLCPNCHSQTDTYRSKNSKKLKYICEENGYIDSNNDKKNRCRDCNKKIAEKNKRCKKCALKHGSDKLNKKCKDCGKNICKTSKRCNSCNRKRVKFRKVADRPSEKKLRRQVEKYGYCATGRKYGVTDNAIRKWLRSYDE